MLLSSYERARRYVCVEDNASNRRVLNSMLYSVSANIEAYLDRQFELISRTEYFNVEEGQREFYVKAPEITTITSVEVDPTGEFTGSETAISASYIGRTGSSVVLQFAQIPAKRGLKIVYTGGSSTTASRSTYTLSNVFGSFNVGDFLEGDTSGAFGIIKSYNISSKVMTVEVIYGAFIEGETVKTRDTEDSGFSSGISATLLSIDTKSFVEVYPEIAQAVDVQIRYNFKTKDDFENTSVEKDSVKRRVLTDFSGAKGSAYMDLQPETRSLIQKFRRHVFY